MDVPEEQYVTEYCTIYVGLTGPPQEEETRTQGQKSPLGKGTSWYWNLGSMSTEIDLAGDLFTIERNKQIDEEEGGMIQINNSVENAGAWY